MHELLHALSKQSSGCTSIQAKPQLTLPSFLLTQTPNRTGDPLLTRPAVAFPVYDQPEFDHRLVARLDDTYIALQPMSLLVSRARRALEDKLRSVPKDLRASTDYVVLDMPCTFFAARTARALPLATQVARALPFSREVEALATRTVAALAVRGHVAFNGVHLRIEKDAGDWSIIMGGAGRIWHIYCETMRKAGINATLPLYVATGLLSYGATSEWGLAKRILSGKNLTSQVLTKDEFVPKFELKRMLGCSFWCERTRRVACMYGENIGQTILLFNDNRAEHGAIGTPRSPDPSTIGAVCRVWFFYVLVLFDPVPVLPRRQVGGQCARRSTSNWNGRDVPSRRSRGGAPADASRPLMMIELLVHEMRDGPSRRRQTPFFKERRCQHVLLFSTDLRSYVFFPCSHCSQCIFISLSLSFLLLSAHVRRNTQHHADNQIT